MRPRLLILATLLACNNPTPPVSSGLAVTLDAPGVAARGTVSFDAARWSFSGLDSAAGWTGSASPSGPKLYFALAGPNAATTLATLRFNGPPAVDANGAQVPGAPSISSLEAQSDPEATPRVLTGTPDPPPGPAYPAGLDAAWARRDLGDLNADGSVNAADAQAILDLSSGKAPTADPSAVYLADLDGDRAITPWDAARAWRKAVNPALAAVPVAAFGAFTLNTSEPGQATILLIGNAGRGPLGAPSIAPPSGVTVTPLGGGPGLAFELRATESAVPSGTLAIGADRFPIMVRDTTPPSVNLNPTGGLSLGAPGSVTLTVSATDNRQITRLRLTDNLRVLTGGSGDPIGFTARYGPQENGVHGLQADARDDSGNQGLSGYFKVTVDIPGVYPKLLGCGPAPGDPCQVGLFKTGTIAGESSGAQLDLNFTPPPATLPPVAVGSRLDASWGCQVSYGPLDAADLRVVIACPSAHPLPDASGAQEIARLEAPRGVSITSTNVTFALPGGVDLSGYGQAMSTPMP